jgi:hypothetical protein
MSYQSNLNTINALSWNIEAGGFSDYDLDLSRPAREAGLSAGIRKMSTDLRLDAVTLIDAYRWGEIYGGEAGIARHLGFQDARFTALDDDGIGNLGPHVGIAFATNRTIQDSRELDLDTRRGLGVIMDVGRHGLQIANVYLDHTNEDRRLQQTKALLSSIEPDSTASQNFYSVLLFFC